MKLVVTWGDMVFLVLFFSFSLCVLFKLLEHEKNSDFLFYKTSINEVVLVCNLQLAWQICLRKSEWRRIENTN